MATIFAFVVATIHVYIFYLESVAWGRPRTNKAFRVSAADAQVNRGFAFNQGFYNLFLSTEIMIGLALARSGREAEGNMLTDFGILSVLCAGMVLFFSGKNYRTPALIQGLPALAYIGFRALGY
ncbi:MAG TPA: DUF1304 domain-containing protein [Bdellovibrionota bacterium]|jgi:putative membrane protein